MRLLIDVDFDVDVDNKKTISSSGGQMDASGADSVSRGHPPRTQVQPVRLKELFTNF